MAKEFKKITGTFSFSQRQTSPPIYTVPVGRSALVRVMGFVGTANATSLSNGGTVTVTTAINLGTNTGSSFGNNIRPGIFRSASGPSEANLSTGIIRGPLSTETLLSDNDNFACYLVAGEQVNLQFDGTSTFTAFGGSASIQYQLFIIEEF